MVVVLAFAVPRKLHDHPAILVAVYFLARRPGDGGDLRAVDARFGKQRCLPFDVIGHEFSFVAVLRTLLGFSRFLLLADVLFAVMHDTHRSPVAIPFLARMAVERESHAGNETRVVALYHDHARVPPQREQPCLRERFVRS